MIITEMKWNHDQAIDNQYVTNSANQLPQFFTVGGRFGNSGWKEIEQSKYDSRPWWLGQSTYLIARYDDILASH